MRLITLATTTHAVGLPSYAQMTSAVIARFSFDCSGHSGSIDSARLNALAASPATALRQCGSWSISMLAIVPRMTSIAGERKSGADTERHQTRGDDFDTLVLDLPRALRRDVLTVFMSSVYGCS